MEHYRLEGHEVVAMNVDTHEGLIAWAQTFEKADRVVMQTRLIDGSRISTVFLGLDHQWGDGPPHLFETCLFSGEKYFNSILKREVSESEIVARYSTWAEAEEGHIEWIEKCVPPDMIAATADHQTETS
jgi:hypothetical protein